MKELLDKILELRREITTLRLENKRLKEKCKSQKEMHETFIATLESISQVCDKTTSGNVSHNMLLLNVSVEKCYNFTIKYKVLIFLYNNNYGNKN